MPSITLACAVLHSRIMCTAFQKLSTSLSYKSRANESALAVSFCCYTNLMAYLN